MNKLNYQGKWGRLIDGEQDDSSLAVRGQGYWVEGLNKREKGLMDIDNGVVIAEEKGHKGTKW